MKTTRTSIAIIGCLFIGAVAISIAFKRQTSSHSTTDTSTTATSIIDTATADTATAVARARIAEASSLYAAAEADDIAATRKTINDILAAARKEVSGKTDAATQPFRGFGNATSCAAMGAKDKLCGGHELQDHIRRSLEPATGLLTSTREKILVQIASARQNSMARVNDYRKETLQFARDAGMSPNELDTGLPAIGEMAKTLDHSVDQTISAGIGVSLEVIFIRSTITILVSVLEPAIATAAGTAGAAGTACVADGPFPIGKIIGATIAVGGTAWTAKEIWQAIDEINRLPGKIEGLLNEQIDSLDKAATGAIDQLEEGYRPLFAPVL